MFSARKYIVVSSAIKYYFPSVIDSVRSFAKAENNLGPNIEPWGTPNLTFWVLTCFLRFEQTARA